MELADLPAYLGKIASKVPDGAVPAAVFMAVTYQKAVQRNLAVTRHDPFTFTPSPPGFFPSAISGDLGRSISMSGAGGGGGRGYARVSSDLIYSAVQEFGHVMHSHSWRRPMTWYNAGRWWSRHEVTVPPRPYMRPTTIQCIANGSLGDAAARGFEIAVWGR